LRRLDAQAARNLHRWTDFVHGVRYGVVMSMIRKKLYRIGDMVKVKAISPPCYSLPDELPDGATVKVVGKICGYDDVEYEGKIFRISMVLIESGYETKRSGMWPDRERRIC
jgi:hypothetical protein